MSEVVDVPDDSPPRSPDVECPYSEEGSSEKTMETRKRAADAVDKDEREGDDEVVDVTPKKVKIDETDVEKLVEEENQDNGDVIVEEPVDEQADATQEESADEPKEDGDEDREEEEEEEENGAEEEQEDE